MNVNKDAFIVRHLMKRAADLRQGLKYLPERDLTDYERDRLRVRLGAKLAGIERRLFNMRQGRLL